MKNIPETLKFLLRWGEAEEITIDGSKEICSIFKSWSVTNDLHDYAEGV